MAGYRIGCAAEFIEAARNTYLANFPETPIEVRDIRQVLGSDLLATSGIERGAVDVLEGSPPCSSFSTAGKRHKKWGTVNKYSDGQQRTDDLFFEYARLVGEIYPKVFVAENVSGLVNGSAVGYFKNILAALTQKGYRVAARLLDAQWLGVPQMRQRIIFVGVRNDLGREPVFPKPLPYRYAVRDAVPWLGDPNAWNMIAPTTKTAGEDRGPNIAKYAIGREWERTQIGQSSNRYFNLTKIDPARPCPTILAGHGSASIAGIVHPFEKRKLAIREVRRLCSFPDDFLLTGTFEEKWERCGRAVPPLMMYRIAATILTDVFGDPLPQGATF